MTKLSININKVATIRNARGGNIPNVIQFAKDCERFGADGITVHPRPDERHIKYNDVLQLSEVVTTEFNIEGYPDERYLSLIKKVKPEQATLVPDPPNVITSNTGWDVIKNMNQLKEIIAEIKSYGIRVSIFLNPETEQVHAAKESGTDRIEFYTGPYAEEFPINKEKAIEKYITAAKDAHQINLGINAGHDLNLDNLKFFKQSLIQLDEISIGHAIISDALYYGIENTIQLYKRQLM
ncbi:MAG: pyridoxine 5'-phosphate synthase [Fimbriimonadaceae bacterium]|nr:pyridoxine 5'-phosphate synthase [Chitinophagales bacterium]